MTELPEAFQRHVNASYVNEADVRSAFGAGAFTVTFVDLVSPARRLIDIYSGRARHLEQQASPNGKQLAADIVQFCRAVESLESDTEVAASAVTLEDGRVLIVWEAMATRKLLGVFSVPDPRMLSD